MPFVFNLHLLLLMVNARNATKQKESSTLQGTLGEQREGFLLNPSWPPTQCARHLGRRPRYKLPPRGPLACTPPHLWQWEASWGRRKHAYRALQDIFKRPLPITFDPSHPSLKGMGVGNSNLKTLGTVANFSFHGICVPNPEPRKWLLRDKWGGARLRGLDPTLTKK